VRHIRCGQQAALHSRQPQAPGMWFFLAPYLAWLPWSSWRCRQLLRPQQRGSQPVSLLLAAPEPDWVIEARAAAKASLAASEAELNPPRSSRPVWMDEEEEDDRPRAYQDPSRLRYSDLNVQLQPDHLERKRFGLNPLQAYGVQIKWDTCFDRQCLRDLNAKVWTQLAEEQGLAPPEDAEAVQRASSMIPERAIQLVFRWTDDWGETRKLSFEYNDLFMRALGEHQFEVGEGVKRWLSSLEQYGVPCALSSRFARAVTERSLEDAGLRGYFSEVVTAEDGCASEEEACLVAALKLNRPPMRCVVIDDEPRGVTAAHDMSSKAVGVIGKHTGYELCNADIRIRDYDELTLMSLRDLFASDEPDW